MKIPNQKPKKTVTRELLQDDKDHRTVNELRLIEHPNGGFTIGVAAEMRSGYSDERVGAYSNAADCLVALAEILDGPARPVLPVAPVTTLLYGPPRTGKTFHQDTFALKYCQGFLVPEWCEGDDIQPGRLHVTNTLPSDVSGFHRVVDIVTARADCGLEPLPAAGQF